MMFSKHVGSCSNIWSPMNHIEKRIEGLYYNRAGILNPWPSSRAIKLGLMKKEASMKLSHQEISKVKKSQVAEFAFPIYVPCKTWQLLLTNHPWVYVEGSSTGATAVAELSVLVRPWWMQKQSWKLVFCISFLSIPHNCFCFVLSCKLTIYI